MKSILNNKQESKAEKLKHMKLEVMQPKMKKKIQLPVNLTGAVRMK